MRPVRDRLLQESQVPAVVGHHGDKCTLSREACLNEQSELDDGLGGPEDTDKRSDIPFDLVTGGVPVAKCVPDCCGDMRPVTSLAVEEPSRGLLPEASRKLE